ncbi:MAG TPA: aconitase X catalytic domain-containing protein [Anaerolineae bacterium]|nr:aconitase X catalytic domain-containing protein [Anaerolineae bacterium]HPL29587.1 aconitase X catalytic domain-containing protein [Anaerolineae bacterium]
MSGCAPDLTLDPADEACLAGACGEGARLAAQLVVALGRIYGAGDLVPVGSVQVAGVSYRNLGAAGLGFLRDWAAKGASARVPALLNPAGIDLVAWREHGIPEAFARQQLAVIEAYRRLGVTPSCTCTPYLVGNVPRYGEHLAWSESSAVALANSVLGARTNREGGPSALAAAILGKTARYGLHLDAGRRAGMVIDVTCPLRSTADFGALGYLVGRLAGDAVPLLRLRACPEELLGQPDLVRSPYLPHLKGLGAAMAASGAVALYHIAGVTPEARVQGEALVAPGATHCTIADLAPGYAALNTAGAEVDIVSIGCPHASLGELAAAADLLQGRHTRTALWITSARATIEEARRCGIAEPLERAGARLIADTCLVVAPLQHYGFHAVATNSAKLACYAPGHCGLATRYGPLEACVEAAVSGVMRDA